VNRRVQHPKVHERKDRKGSYWFFPYWLDEMLPDRYREWIAEKGITQPNDWIFAQEEDRTKPMWDSGVRKALKIAAQDAECDFEGFGLHSFRRANITWRQEVGGSAIEASKIAGHATVSMTGDYTIVQARILEIGNLSTLVQSDPERAKAEIGQAPARDRPNSPRTRDRASFRGFRLLETRS
jgi:integrase